MSIYMRAKDEEILWQEKDEEILWQMTFKFKFQTIIFLISLITSVIGIVTFSILLSSRTPLVSGFALVMTVIIGLSILGMGYTLINWLPVMSTTPSYFATNKKIVDKWERKEYNEYFTYEYSKINKIEIRPRIFFKDRGVSIKIFPKFKSTNPFEWIFRYYKDGGVKVPQRNWQSAHTLHNVSDYEPLLKILKQHHIKIIKK